MKNQAENTSKPKFSDVIFFGKILLVRHSLKLVTLLTKYFPFSLINNRWVLHYKNKDIADAWDVLFYESLKGPLFSVKGFDMDQYFVYFHGYFNKFPNEQTDDDYLERLKKKFGDMRVFMRRDNKKFYTINISREAIHELPPKSFFSWSLV